jgi:hypothetical protein
MKARANKTVVRNRHPAANNRFMPIRNGDSITDWRSPMPVPHLKRSAMKILSISAILVAGTLSQAAAEWTYYVPPTAKVPPMAGAAWASNGRGHRTLQVVLQAMERHPDRPQLESLGIAYVCLSDDAKAEVVRVCVAAIWNRISGPSNWIDLTRGLSTGSIDDWLLEPILRTRFMKSVDAELAAINHVATDWRLTGIEIRPRRQHIRGVLTMAVARDRDPKPPVKNRCAEQGGAGQAPTPPESK